MATTTNYGWTTPNDTDLVKDGAAAIRTLGSSIDTTVFANASAGIPKTIVDAKGDLIAGTASDTVSRLAVGTDGQVLLADSTAGTGLAWGTPAAGSMTLLSTTTLSGATTTISSINQGYKHLQIYMRGIVTSAGTDQLFQPNNTNMRSSGVQASASFNQTSGAIGAGGSTTINVCNLTLYNYTNTTNSKPLSYAGHQSTNAQFIGGGFVQDNSAITLIRFACTGGATYSAGTVEVYGVN